MQILRNLLTKFIFSSTAMTFFQEETMDYQLEIKQIVDYPRCRIYRDFLRTLMNDDSIRVTGDSYLYYYMTLCSYANYRSSYRKLEGISYLVAPGEWICKISELSKWFRTKYHHQAIAILDFLQKQNHIRYTRLGRNNLIKYQILGWNKFNTTFDYNYPCLKDVGFFFFPIAAGNELISYGKCSEMDIVLDLWLHAIFNDETVQGSDLGPVVYFRNATGNPVINYTELAMRWGLSRSTVCRVLNKLHDNGYLSLISFSGKHGSIIYLCNYLSTMFSISDVMIDKEEVSMTFKIPIQLPDNLSSSAQAVSEDQLMIEKSSVSEESVCVSKNDILPVIQKAAEILATQGVSCCECPKTIYKLSELSGWKEPKGKYRLNIQCPGNRASYVFELTLSPIHSNKGEAMSSPRISHFTKSAQ